MRYFIEMKREEWKMKWKFYKAINSAIENYKDVYAMSKKMFDALKDVPVDKLREEFVSKLAEIIHEGNKTE
jgi:hypothetical protein